MVKFRIFLKWFFVGLVILFIYAPILLLTINSFNKSNLIQNWEGFSLDHYRYFFSFDHDPLPAVLNTLVLAAVVGTLSTILGSVGAIGIFYSRKKVSGLLSGVNRIPIINAGIVTAISIALLVTFLKLDKSTFIPLIIGQMVLCTPFVILSVIPKLKQMDNNLYEAALDLGATPTRALFTVIIPQILPGIVSGFLLSVTLSLDDYVIAEYTRPQSFYTISTYIYSLNKKNADMLKASFWAFTAIVFLIIVIVVVAANVAASKKSKKQINKE